MDESTPVPIPQLLSRVADAGDAAAAKLESWGVRLETDSRLAQASALLRAAAERGRLNADHESVAPVLRAVWVAADFADIAEYLPEDRVKSVRQELSIALRGELWPSKGSRQPLQFQTQHMVGAILLHSGIEIEHIPFSSKRQVKAPEFFFMDCLTRVGVEVKRPESRARIPTLLGEAMQKFTPHDCYGAIVLEITDCLEGVSEAEFLRVGQEVMAEAHATVWNIERNEYRPGFRSLLYLGGIVRGGWEVPAEDQSRLRLVGHAFHQGYIGHPGSLQSFVSDRTRASFNRAIAGVVQRLSASVR